jgi:hypothetical protein
MDLQGLKNSFSWDIILCIPVKNKQHFLGTYHFHIESSNYSLVHTDFLLGLLFDSEDGGSIFLQDTGQLSMDYMASHHSK